MSSKRNKRTSIAMISGAVLLMTSLGACNKFQSADKLVSEARQYQQKGDDKAAVIQLKNALQKDPNNINARYMLAGIYNETGDPVSAEKELRKALSLGLSADKARVDLGKSLLMQGQFQKVLDETKTDAGAKPDAALLSLRGNAYLALNQAAEAKQSFDDALKVQPNYVDALIGLSKYAFGQKDVATATQIAEQAIATNPKSADAWLFKGDIARSQGKTDDALAAYAETLKIQPDSVAAHLTRANVEIGLRKFDEAQRDIDAVKKVSPGHIVALYTQALLHFSQGKNAPALESLQLVQRGAPDYMPGVLLTGAVQFALGSYEQAEQAVKKYLGAYPNNLYAQKLMAGILIKSRQAKRALALLEPALKQYPQDNQLTAMAGEASMQAKDFAKATEYFEKASSMAPENADYHTALGLSKLGSGDNDKAIAELEKASDLDAKSSRAGILLVMTHLRLKEYDKAMVAVQALEKESPENPMIQNLKGGIYLNQKKSADARASFEKALSLQATYFPAAANLANMDMQDKKVDSAKKRFVAILDKDKKNMSAMLALANIALMEKNNEEARRWLEKANNDNPSSFQPAQLLATHYLRMGDKQKAVVFAKKEQTLNPTVPEFLGLLARVQQATGDNEGALDSYGKIAAMLPESPAAQFSVVLPYLTLNRDAEALEATKKTLRLDPNYRDAQTALAMLEAKKGNFEQSLQVARQTQKQDPKSPMGYVTEGNILMVQKKFGPAVAAFEKGLALGKNSEVLIKLHAALWADGKTKEADARLNQWLKDNPSDYNARMYLATFLLATQKSKQAAIEQFQILLKTAPQNVTILNNLAWAYDQEKDPKALGYAEQAFKLAPDSAAVLDTYGWLLIQKDDITGGLPLLKKAAALSPTAAEIRFHLAQALLKSGDKIGARVELEATIANGKGFARLDEAKTQLSRL
ncbi:XrtA/PEP-CTERM system TPR-repeat protein PrsT [Undibacterium sp.]|jgi:putative PEP-CTERM system TPR-repeat lipoprotein|uniref:XrtA/PEP-CTERM system TPR-repeat protein PrsT n=1 Tax=Undibacterium sp. TaxID=1914977 RepID=UPI002C46980D|nr:XrtA/PEP-CTERM system TPR-repeat protein PrsT [Undibacterium sp.]HTD04329.1 XrtA/PEP-CTERM system TPR-repeat protein PrsT [Undibacterium sp.]